MKNLGRAVFCKRLIGAASAGLSMTLLLSACGDKDASPASNGPVKNVTLAYVGYFSGDLDVGGSNAAQMAVDQANERNKGLHIDFKIFDTAKATDVAALGQQVIDDPAIVAVEGTTRSGDAATLLPIMSPANMAMVSPTATRPGLGATAPAAKVFHRIVPDDNKQASLLRDYIGKRLGAKRVAYVYDETAYGKGLAEGVEQLLQSANIATSLKQEANATTTDYSAILRQIKDSRTDLVFYGGYYQGAGEFRKQMVASGVKADFVGSDGVLAGQFATDGSGAYITCGCAYYTENSPGSGGDFARSYRAKFGKPATTYTAEAYDAAMVLVKAMESGATTRQAINDYLANMPAYDGVTKSIKFDQNGDLTTSAGVFVYGALGGQITPIENVDALL